MDQPPRFGELSCPSCLGTTAPGVSVCPHCGSHFPNPEEILRLHKTAGFALGIGVLGFACGLFFGPIAAYMGWDTNRRLLEMGQPPSGPATAALILGICSTAFYLLGTVLLFSVAR